MIWLKKKSAKTFIAISIAIWGGLSVACGFVQETWQLLVLRFVLGVAEGGVWPAILVMLSHWFPADERARANALFIMSLAIACMITGPISGTVIAMWGWRSVFWFEGALSILLIFVWWPLIADRPSEAKWISKEEREYLESTIAQEEALVSGKFRGPVNYSTLAKNLNLWKLSYIYLAYQVGVYGFVMWLPTILKELTKSGIGQIGLLSALPYLVAIPGMYYFAKWSDKGHRGMATALPALGMAICLILSVVLKDQVWLAYAFLCIFGYFWEAYNGPFWTYPPMLFPSKIAGGARGAINGIGNLGGFVGPFFVGWLITQSGNSDWGMYFLGIVLISATLVSFTLPNDLEM